MMSYSFELAWVRERYFDVAFVGVEVVVGFLGHGEGENHDEWSDKCDEEAYP
jgi:hypothetical protein